MYLNSSFHSYQKFSVAEHNVLEGPEIPVDNSNCLLLNMLSFCDQIEGDTILHLGYLTLSIKIYYCKSPQSQPSIPPHGSGWPLPTVGGEGVDLYSHLYVPIPNF